MKCTKILTLAAFAVTATLSLNSHADDTVKATAKAAQSLNASQNPNKIIINTLFPNVSPAENARLQEQVQKYSQIQYGFGTAKANRSPVKDEDVLNNIKSHDPETVKSQMTLMREAAISLPKLEQIQTKTKNNKP